MVPRTYSSKAIVLARKNYSEADRILVVFSKNFGKLSLLAKGVRRTKSRKRAHIEVFNRLKFSAARGKSLDIITEADVIDSFSDVKNNLKKVTVAYFFMEVVGRITREGEKHDDVYILLKDYLERLRTSESLKQIRKDFIYNILVTLGFWPEGRALASPDKVLEEVLERPQYSVRVGKELLT
jgi:DNA repair protein RecO (recombination protein O)